MNLYFQLFLLVLVMTFSDAIGTLKMIFTAKRYFKPVYAIVFVESIILLTVITKVAAGGGYLMILAFGVGKVIGVFVGGKIAQKISIGLIEANILVSDKDKMIAISDHLREAGLSVNTIVTYGMHGNKRYVVEVTAQRKEIGNIKKLLKSAQCENPTMTIKDVSNVYGKVCNF